MEKSIKLSLIAAVAALTFGGFTATTTNLDAAAKTVKVAHHKGLKKNSSKKHAKKAKKSHKKLTQHDKDVIRLRNEILHPKKNTQSTPKQTAPKADKIANGYNYTKDEITDYNTYEQVYLQTELKAINDYRNSQGVASLTLDTNLSNIANQRSKQNYDFRNASWYDGHDDQNGNFIAEDMANQMNIKYNVLGENSDPGEFTGEDDLLEDPITAATAEVNEIIGYGKGETHYDNLVDPSYKTIGLGIYVGPNQGQNTKGGTDQVFAG